MDFSFLLDFYYWEIFLKGLGMTLVLAILAVSFGTILGFIPALMRVSGKKVLEVIASFYVEVIRGTPLLVQVLLIYSFIKVPATVVMGIELSSFIPGMLALLINSSAYVSEVIRGGILSVPKGQLEASQSLGLSYPLSLRKVILPQAIKNILPQLGNEFVTMIKETSIFMYLGIAELMYSAQIIRSQTYQVKESYIVVAVLYLLLTFPTSRLMAYFEKRLKKSDAK